MNLVLSSLTIIAILLSTGSSQAAVWNETQSWTPEWEQRYSNWVQFEFNEDIYTHGPYKGMATDCADAVYYARIIFAYENKLPFVIKDSTGGTNKITNQMSRYDGTKDSLTRVRKFMNYVGDTVSTKSLPNDTYPVAINRTYVRPGTVWSRPRVTKDNLWRQVIGANVQEDPGHAEMVKDVSETGVVNLIGSTVPKEVRKLNLTSSLVFMPIETSTGFRNWKTPANYSQAEASLPGYSLEQFNEIGRGKVGRRNLKNWTADVQDHLALRIESKGEFLTRQITNVCGLVNSRVIIIQKSEARRIQLQGQCMDASDYDSYSTPSRDKRIKLTLKQIVDTAGGNGLTAAQKAKSLKSMMDQCPDIEIAPGKKISLYDFSIDMLKKDISSNPNDSFAARWGLEPAAPNKCPKYE